MIGEKAGKVIVAIVGVLFVAAIYPLVKMTEDPTLQMMLSLYVTLGVFLLLASRNPSANRSLIAFAAWSSFAHAGTMAVQSVWDMHERTHLLVGTTMFAIVGLLLIVAAPAKTRVPATS